MKKLIIANWKSHQNVAEVKEWLANFKELLAKNNFKFEGVEVVLAPSFVNLVLIEEFLRQNPEIDNLVDLATQDISPFAEGSYTGAVGSENLEGHAVNYAIVGHSERRRLFEEDDEQVAKKVQAALDAGIVPILCLDEAYIESQAKQIDPSLYAKCVIAYEPLSAIGSGDNAPIEDVERVVSKVKQVYGDVPVIYGGSLDAANIKDYLDITDGALVGTASKQAEEFVDILKVVGD